MGAQVDPRLSCTELESLRATLGLESTRDRRRHARHTLPKGFVLAVRVMSGDAQASVFAATGRDLSASGIGFYHSSPIEQGSACEVELRTIGGEASTIPGTVVRSRQIKGRLHDVAVEFHYEIDPAEFVRTSSPTATQDAMRALNTAGELTARLVGELTTMVDARADRDRVASKVREVQQSLSAARRCTCSPKKGA